MHINIQEQTEDYLVQLVKWAIAGEEIIWLIPLKQDNKHKPRRGGQ